MIVQNDAAHVVIEALGKLGICEFRDVCTDLKAQTAEQPPPPPPSIQHPRIMAPLTDAHFARS